MMKRFFMLATLGLLWLSGSPAFAAMDAPSLGKADAPVVIDEYASFTCSHCSEFYIDTLPLLEKKYIETGKLRIVFHDFPLDGVSLKAAAIVHCLPESQRTTFIGALYKNQSLWAFGGKPEQSLIQYAKLAGMSEDAVKICLGNTTLMDAIIKERQEASSKYNIQATPTFIFNGGKEKLMGAEPMKKFEEVIDRLLAGK